MGVGARLRLLLDTHAFLWWLSGDTSLSARAIESLADERNLAFVSAASAWEITTKFRLGKLPGAAAIVPDVEAAVASQAFLPLPVTVRHGQSAGSLPGSHRDPFDRILIAQALIDGLVLVSNEKLFDAYGISRLW